MSDLEKDERLKTLSDRLNKAKAQEAEKEWQDEPPSTAWGVASRMGVELVAAIAVGAFIGFWVDKWFDTKPLFLIILLFLGFASGLRNVIREARKSQEEADEG